MFNLHTHSSNSTAIFRLIAKATFSVPQAQEIKGNVIELTDPISIEVASRWTGPAYHFAEYYGSIPTATAHLIDRTTGVMHPWFWGSISSEESIRLLVQPNTRLGLVRFGSNGKLVIQANVRNNAEVTGYDIEKFEIGFSRESQLYSYNLNVRDWHTKKIINTINIQKRTVPELISSWRQYAAEMRVYGSTICPPEHFICRPAAETSNVLPVRVWK